jgi:small-conductance mechanosensitive channel
MSAPDTFHQMAGTILERILNYIARVSYQLTQDFVNLLPVLIGKSILAIIVLYIGIRTSRWAVQVSGRPIAKTLRNPSAIKMALRVIRYFILLLTLLVILGIYGIWVDLTALGLSVGIASVVLGIILAPIFTRYLAGVFIISDRPYTVGDFIEISDTDITGYVEGIEWRYTRIKTADNKIVVTPNVKMIDNTIVNYSAEDLRVRVEVPVTITYESDFELAKRIMSEIPPGVDGVVKEGSLSIMGVEYDLSPRGLVQNFGDNGIEMILRYWLERPYKPRIVQDEVMSRLFKAFQENDIGIPYPHRHVLFDDGSKFPNASDKFVSERG